MEQRKGQAQNAPNLKYIISPNGTVMIHLVCSEKPFRLYHEEDISTIMTFMGRVEDRLRYLFNYTIDEIILPVSELILKECDVSKDIEIGEIAQLTGINIQVKSAIGVFRSYGK